MKRLLRPLRRVYLDDITYRNFLVKEYLRRKRVHALHKEPSPVSNSKEALTKHDGIAVNKYLLIFLTVIIVASLMFFTRELITATSYIIFLAIASCSTAYKRKIGVPLGGIELVTFGTVITSVAFGPFMGALFGLVSSATSEIISQNIGPLTGLYVLTMATIGALAGALDSINIIILGLSAVVLTLLLNNVPYLFAGDEEVKSMTSFYILTNLTFNSLVFAMFGSRILQMLS